MVRLMSRRGNKEQAPVRRRGERENEQPLARLRDEFEALFDRFVNRWQSSPPPAEREFDIGRVWDLEVDDRDNEVVVRAEVPGFEPDELDVQVSGRLLTIRAEKQEQREETRGGYFTERRYRAFQRTVMLPPGVRTEGTEAKYRNGVLEIHLPKSDEAKPKRISAQA